MRIEWDPAKSESNKTKHGIAFERAQLVFDDPRCVTSPERAVDGEERWHAIGLIAVRVHHRNDDDSRDQADGVPPFFTVHCTLGGGNAAWVVEHQLRPFERDAMLCLIALTLCRVPFDAHLYLQYCPYEHVESRRKRRAGASRRLRSAMPR